MVSVTGFEAQNSAQGNGEVPLNDLKFTQFKSLLRRAHRSESS